MIKLLNITKSFGKHTVLSKINLTIEQGQIYGIIGKSGAGKSTLLRCINGLERPESGQVIIDKVNLLELPAANLNKMRHNIGMIFQQFNLLSSKSVYDNIALPMRIQKVDEKTITNKVNELLELVQLSDKANAYPNDLSGGQKQRVAIARALSCSPKILLCDEATSALDPATTESILSLLKKINRLYGITIVLITHEMDVVKRICQKLTLLEAGHVVETVTLSEVLSSSDSLAKKMLFADLSPELPPCLSETLSDKENDTPLVKIYFEGRGATIPFISQASRELEIDINILLANIDRIDTVTCGVLVAEISAPPLIMEKFIQRCNSANLKVEVLGYVH